jgi:hypothetical protein
MFVKLLKWVNSSGNLILLEVFDFFWGPFGLLIAMVVDWLSLRHLKV